MSDAPNARHWPEGQWTGPIKMKDRGQDDVFREILSALDELSMQCEREFGDLKEEPDDASVFAKEDSTPTITFGAIRRARAAVKKARGGT